MSTFNCLRQLWLWSFLQPMKNPYNDVVCIFQSGFCRAVRCILTITHLWPKRGLVGSWLQLHTSIGPQWIGYTGRVSVKGDHKRASCLDRHWDPPGRGLVCVHLHLQVQVHLVDTQCCFLVHWEGSVITGNWGLAQIPLGKYANSEENRQPRRVKFLINLVSVSDLDLDFVGN